MNIGGPSIHVTNLTEGLDKRLFKTKLIIGSLSPNEGDMRFIANLDKDVQSFVPELQREINPVKDIVALLKIIKIIFQFKPDIIHSHTSKAGAISRISATFCNLFRSKKIKVVHTFHGNVLDSYFGKYKTYIILTIERMLAGFTDCIIAISSTQKWHLSKKYKIASSSKISTIRLGFDLIQFVQAQQFEGQLRKKIGIYEDTLLIGIVGRLAPIKNHKMFLDAAKKYLDETDNKKVLFLMVGDGELRQSLDKYCFEIGLKDYVFFYGWEKNTPVIYADMDILALTSLNEGTPVSIIEAMAASVPVITTDVGGIKDLLGRFESEQPFVDEFKVCERGILCRRNDSISFSKALKFMVEGSFLKDRERIAKTKNFILNNYSTERLIRDIETLYLGLLN
jgi:glycosyltransferase involved in cell wall biosynthesis